MIISSEVNGTPSATIVTGNSITIVVSNKQYSVIDSHPYFEKIKQKLKDQDYNNLVELFDIKLAVTKQSNGLVEIKGNDVYFEDKILHNALSSKIIQMFKEGFDIEPLKNFMVNLMQNPSYVAVQELYLFLESGKMPITKDGHFLAYKKVKEDYHDIYTGKFDHSIGQTLQMNRNEVDPDRHNTCSAGFHFCSYDYLHHYGASESSKIVIVKINPSDVVAIPSDYNNTKGRTWKYEVVGEVPYEEAEKFFSSAVDEKFTSRQTGDYDDLNEQWENGTFDDDYEIEEEIFYASKMPNGTFRYRNADGRFVGKSYIDGLPNAKIID